ncbi:MAG: VOC family protein [Pseudomonadota bacterium]
MAFNCSQIIHHSLYIRDAERSLQFYQDVVGMELCHRIQVADCEHLLLGFGAAMRTKDSRIARAPHCLLHLICNPQHHFDNQERESGDPLGYWKIALAVADLNLAHQRLQQLGIRVSQPFQVPDVAYLCHFEDPDGYCIELIQHQFEQNHEALQPDPAFALQTPTAFSLITLRAKDPEASLAFYRDQLGLKLVSKQVVSHRGFTLYFLSCDDEPLPSNNVEDIVIREWLWQRPYAVLELQHVWGTQDEDHFEYLTGPETGFKSFSLLSDKLATAIHGRTDHAVFGCPSLTLKDPDGYQVEVFKAN